MPEGLGDPVAPRDAAGVALEGGLPGRRLDIIFNDAVLDKPYDEDPHRWLIVLHCIGIMYMLLGLNTVCDVYFTGALSEMVERWDVTPDVAGATFMAAGGSAPELFTSLIGTLIAKNDVGFGTIVGSAVFNVLFVIGLCGLLAKTEISLTWWPLFRDCTYYIIGLTVLAIFAADETIKLHEAIILFLAYIGYCVMMYFNPALESLTDFEFQRAKKQVTSGSPGAKEPADVAIAVVPSAVVPQEPADVAIAVVPQENKSESSSDRQCLPMVTYGRPQQAEDASEPKSQSSAQQQQQLPPQRSDKAKRTSSCSGNEKVSHKTRHSILLSSTSSLRHDERMASIGSKSREGEGHLFCAAGGGDSSRRSVEDNSVTPVGAQEDGSVKVHPPGADNADEGSDDDKEENLLARPEGGVELLIWCVSLPVYIPLHFTMPNPSSNWFLACFFLSLLWIAGFSFFLVWWVEILGIIIGIPTFLMGLTLLAAGTSIPDAISSVAVARDGQGDMAISSSIGSNIFDILVGLPIPWIIRIGFMQAGDVVINSPFLPFHVALLLGMVFLVILCIHMLKWKLNKTLGLCMAVLYAMFLCIAISVESTEPEELMFSRR